MRADAFSYELPPSLFFQRCPMARSVVFAILVSALASAASAQDFSITLLWADRGPNDPYQTLNEEVFDAFEAELTLRGISQEGSGLQLYLRTQSHHSSDGEILFVSIVEGNELSENIIEAGAEAQIFYAGTPKPENMEDARFVREYVTREVLSNLVQISHMEQLIFPRSDMNRQISEYFDALFERFECMQPGAECM